MNWKKYIFIFFCILMIIVLFRKNKKEGFETNVKSFITKNNDNIYDEFYCDNYDTIMKDNKRTIFEISHLIKYGKLNANSSVLDIGSGTGHHVCELKKNNFKVIGIDISKYMVKKAKKNYPECDFVQGSINDSFVFLPSTFSHITCFYYTIYYIKDKSLFFDNCKKWLQPGGYIMLHLIDNDTFEYKNKKIKNDTFCYRNEFHLSGNQGTLSEIFNYTTGEVRQNEHKLYMTHYKDIIKMTKSKGIQIHKKIEMESCNYKNHYLFVFYIP